MAYTDLRAWLKEVEKRGELKRIKGAKWDLEMSGITEVVYHEGKSPRPALLFDEIPGYPAGFRTLYGILGSAYRVANTLGLPENETNPMNLVKAWREKARNLRLVPPQVVKSGPVLANRMTGDNVDLLKFPSPRFHELDRSRYFGTGHAVIQRDPDTGWVNLGTYRVMLVDGKRLILHALEGQHGGIIMYEKFLGKGRTMPVVLAIGIDPALFLVSSHSLTPWGMSEFDYAGGIRGEPERVIEGELTGIPFPANSEIVVEGECVPGDLADEGPFGEWHGYYANLGLSSVPEPVIRVKAIYYRDDPILVCAHPSVPPSDFMFASAVTWSAALWSSLEANGIPGIKGVWCHEIGGAILFNVISIEQLYPGHSRQVGLIASQFHKIAGRYTVVVEEDIDPTNLEQVIWAMSTRSLPDQSIQILPRCRSGSADPAIPLEEKKKYKVTPKPLHAARVFVDACRPLESKKDWYPIARMSTDLRAQILKQWHQSLSDVVPEAGEGV